MKSLALLFLVMFCFVHLTTSAPFGSNAARSSCCSEFSKAKIPLKLVKSYYWTSSNCPKQAVVFQTKIKEICVDPETAWVSGHIAKLDNRTTTTTAKTHTTTV